MEYVSITRHFRDRHAKPSSALSRTMLRGVLDPLTWSSLLAGADESHVVLVAPSGLGKSTELKEQAKSLRARGRHSVFVSARELVAESMFDDAFEVDEFFALQKWQSTSDHAVVFVDGVDELVLIGREFNALVRRLGRLLGEHAKRCRYVFSARGGWSQKHAFAVCAGLLGTTDTDSLRELTFEPLHREAVRQLATAQGCQRIDGFMEAYRRNEVETIIDVRPMDVPVLVQRWNRDRELGSRSAMLDGYLDAALSEIEGVRDLERVLTIDDARRGAQRIGAATVLIKAPFATVPSVANVADTIGLRDLYSDWEWRPLTEFVQTALFVQKGASAVQLQQGALPPFLAARWLVARWRRGKNADWLRDQLLVRVYGEDNYVVPDSRRATAGWVASLVPEFRNYLYDYPEIVLYDGDPANLHDDEVVKWLQQLAKSIFLTGAEPMPTRGTALKLARPSIESDVVALLEQAESEPEKKVLLRWAEIGEYASALATAVDLATDREQSSAVRCCAVRVVAACGDLSSRQSLKQVAEDDDADLRTELLPALVPHVLGSQELTEFIMRGGSRLFRFVLADVADAIATSELESLLQQLASFVSRTKISAESDGHFDVAYPLLSARIRRGDPYPDTVTELVLAVEARGGLPAYVVPADFERELGRLLERDAPLRRRLWLARMEREIAEPGGLACHNARFGHQNPEDLAWLLELKGERPAFDSLAMACSERIIASIPDETRDQMAVDGNLAFPLKELLKERARAQAEIEARRRSADDERRAESDAERARNIEALAGRREQLATAGEVGLLVRGWRLISEHGAHRTLSMDRLRDAVGPELLQDFIRGFKALWRVQQVELPDPESNKVLIRNHAALAGIDLEVADGLDFATLTPVLAERAARYALYELNGFPEWFSELIDAHEDVVRRVLDAAVRREWSSTSSSLSLLRHAGYSDSRVAVVLRMVALDVLQDSTLENRNPQALHAAIGAVLISSERLDPLIQTARRAIDSLEWADPRLREWLRAWAHLAPGEAVDWFLDRLATETDLARALLIEVAALLDADFGGVGGQGHAAATRLMDPLALERWISLLVEQLPPGDDDQPNGFMGEQHHAQDFRHRCLTYLANDASPLARKVLLGLGDSEPLTAYPDWASRLLAHQHGIAVEATAIAWTESAIVDVERGDERSPLCLADLFAMVRSHIRDVGRVLTNDDFSYRDLVPPTTKEREIQLWVASTLRQRARGLYSVVRENVVDKDKRVDITAVAPGVGQVPIEIKPASHTAKELDDTLRDQLIGRYMTQHDRTMGILLIVAQARKRWDVEGYGKRRDFSTLLSYLRERARVLGAARNMRIAVEGIDIESSRASAGEKDQTRKAQNAGNAKRRASS